MQHNFNKPVSFCGSCAHFNHNTGTFSFYLIQDEDVFKGDYCDKHTTNRKVANEREKKITQFMGTIFDVATD
ncbi:hypothetical protein [Bacillus sp. FJAT-22090]|uniref:hypothetical protein n=1 Tax=Bacillus sp. FJAT-22090 TaxID=1581038 RepID=UPI0011A41806|nr:hypothetical protein [Bacillus sp. FJAT-22090]